MRSARLTHKLAGLSKPFSLVMALLLLLFVGIADYLTGYELSLMFFYLPPIVLVTWNVGRRAGILVSAAAAAMWCFIDLLGQHTYSRPVLRYWNAVEAFLLFSTVLYLSLLLKRTFYRLEQTIESLQAEISEHKQAEKLATTDPLTGLANYRSLKAVLESEIRRSGRTACHFGLMMLDVDELKKINDRYGHLVGDQALRRVAKALHAACRSTDTPARYAGDEFAVVLPDSGEDAVLQVFARIEAHLAEDPDVPELSVSMGAAFYPTDGAALEALLVAADKALYGMKASRAHRAPAQQQRPRAPSAAS